MTPSPIKLAVLISGGGRTLVNLQQKIDAGELNATIEIVVSSRSDVRGVERSRALGLPTLVLVAKSLDKDTFQNSLADAVDGVDLVCMAGFLSLWTISDDWYGRVINIHPALLPEFGGHGMYGHRVHQAVLEAGKKQSGCTVHFCDNEYDTGPIILQRKVDVLPGDTPDTLASRVFEQECIAYPEAIGLFSQGRVKLEQGRVVLT